MGIGEARAKGMTHEEHSALEISNSCGNKGETRRKQAASGGSGDAERQRLGCLQTGRVVAQPKVSLPLPASPHGIRTCGLTYRIDIEFRMESFAACFSFFEASPPERIFQNRNVSSAAAVTTV